MIRPDPELSPYDTEHHPVTCGRHIVLARQAGEGNWSNPFSRDLRWRRLKIESDPRAAGCKLHHFHLLGAERPGFLDKRAAAGR